MVTDVRGGEVTPREANTRLERLGSPTGVILLNGAALTIVLFHVLVDVHIGLYGLTSTEMAAIRAANAFREALTAGWWLVALAVAMRGSRTGTVCALVLVAGWVLVFDGIVAILVAPPPSAAFPYQDLAHFGAVVVGGLASYALWNQFRRQDGRIHGWYLLATVLWFFVVSRAVSLFVHFG